MVDIYSEFLSDSYGTIKDTKKKKEGYLNIWKINPSYKDINKTRRIFKRIFLLVMGFGYAYTLVFVTANIVISLGFSSFLVVVFVLVFHEQFFSISRIFSKGNFQPFGKYIFWKMMEDPFTLFYTNTHDNFTVGLRTFNIAVIPENIHANMRQFIQSLNSTLVPFSFQVIQKPLPNEREFSFKTILSFNLYYCLKGRITYPKLRELLLKLDTYCSALQSGLASNFHHFKTLQLTFFEIVDNIRASFLPQEILDTTLSDTVVITKTRMKGIIGKILVLVIIILLLDLLLSLIDIPILIRVGIIIGMSVIFLQMFARDILFQLVNSRFFGLKDIDTIDPFANVYFYRFSQAPNTIFFHVKGKITGGIKMANLQSISPPPICFPSKFYIGLIKTKMPFNCSFIMAPMSYYEFDKEAFDYLQEKTKKIHLYNIKNEDHELKWLSQRVGVWKTLTLFSTSYYQESTGLDTDQLLDLELSLQKQITSLITSFKGNFNNFNLDLLRSQYLTSGLEVEALKNKFIHLDGSYLTYILIQGRTITQLIDVVDEFKKGIETRIAAEFNSPLQLENNLAIGSTINTEFLEEEIPAGFTLEQLHNLLIMNGTIKSREYTAMKLVMGLIKNNYPAMIFDFYGEWANIITCFKDTKFADNFLYFKLGKTFNLNPVKSEIPYDKDNIEYLDYMLDAYGLCFKKDGKTMEIFRNTIIRNADVDLSTLNLDLASKREWEKNPVSDALLTFLHEFSEHDMIFFRPVKKEQEKCIKPYEFITNEKTIIIDLSKSHDLAKQCFFMLVILSKCIHYLNTKEKYVAKFLVLPHIDIIFDTFHLDRNIQYGKIDKFLQPLTRRNFGLICSSAQTHYLHPNLLNNYFANYISFKTTDNRDVTQLKNILNLEEVHGQGIYSKNRNESYQIKYLMSMQPEEAIVKRSDLHQPFPVKLDISEVKTIPTIEWEDIIEYMGAQGYDLEHTERQILERARKTIFEKDFGDYAILIDDIIKFLKNLTTVHQIGNLYPTRIKEELKKALYPTLLTITNDKKRMKEMRNNIFEILLRHEYLVEHHPKRASGSESIRTSYSVGSQFQKALDDYFCTQHEVREIPEIEMLESEASSEEIPMSPLAISEEEQTQFLDVLAKEMSDSLYWELFTLHKHIVRENTKEIAEIATNFVKRFFHRLYNRYYNVNYAVIDRDIENFINFMTHIKGFPFSKNELNGYIKDYTRVSETEQLVYYSRLYQQLSDFFTKIQNFINLP